MRANGGSTPLSSLPSFLLSGLAADLIHSRLLKGLLSNREGACSNPGSKNPNPCNWCFKKGWQRVLRSSRSFAPLFVIAQLLLALPAAAHAGTVTEMFNFTATGSQFTASGSYTITFDPTMEYLDNTGDAVDITLDSFTDSVITGPVTAAFRYFPTTGELDITNIGGSIAYNTDSYELQILSANTMSPSFGVFFTGSASQSLSGIERDTSGTITVTSYVANTATPEPCSLALLSTGVLGLAGAARRRLGRA